MINLGPEFEAAVLAAAGLQGLNVEPGSVRIDTLASPVTTVRFTVTAAVGFEALQAAAGAALGVPVVVPEVP